MTEDSLDGFETGREASREHTTLCSPSLIHHGYNMIDDVALQAGDSAVSPNLQSGENSNLPRPFDAKHVAFERRQ